MRTPTSIIDLGSDFVYNDALLLENMQQLFTITGNVPSTCANRLHADTHTLLAPVHVITGRFGFASLICFAPSGSVYRTVSLH